MAERILSVEALNDRAPSRTLIVTPTFNERENVPALFEAVGKIGADLMIVDDASPDGTAEAAKAASAAAPMKAWLVRRRKKAGLGTAYVDGFGWALAHEPGYGTLVEMDADFSHDPALVPRLVEKASRSGVAIGSRYVAGGSTPDWPLRRVLLSRYANLYARAVLRLRFRSFDVRDATAGFVAWRRDVLERVLRRLPETNGYAFQIETKLYALREGFVPTEIPITFRDRTLGASKIDRNIVIEAAVLPWRLLFKK